MSAMSMPWSVGIRFTHAALQVLAEDNGIDLLHIKGPAVDPSLLEVRSVPTPDPAVPDPDVSGATTTVPRRSIDADVLVRPAHVDRLISAMHRHRWTTSFDFKDGSAFEHAATMAHPVLAPVDVHRRFPGIEQDPSLTFDRLWADRHGVDVAGVLCQVPSVTAQRLVLIVHAARAGGLEHPDVRRSWTQAEPEDRAAVQRLAGDLGAELALAAGTGRLHEYRGAKGYSLWLALATRDRSPARLWLARVRAAPNRAAALRTAVRLALPNPHRLERALGRPPTLRETGAAYVVRARMALRDVRVLARRHRAASRPGKEGR